MFGGRAVTNTRHNVAEFVSTLLIAATVKRAVLDDGWPRRHRIWRKRTHQEHPWRDLGAAIRDAFRLPRSGATR